MSDKTVDARGLSCPQPVLLTKRAMNEPSAATLEVLVDSATARDNVARLATKQGWSVRLEETPAGDFHLHLSR